MGPIGKIGKTLSSFVLRTIACLLEETHQSVDPHTGHPLSDVGFTLTVEPQDCHSHIRAGIRLDLLEG